MDACHVTKQKNNNPISNKKYRNHNELRKRPDPFN